MKFLLSIITVIILSCNNNNGNTGSRSATPLTDTAGNSDSTLRININGMPADVPITDSVNNN